MAEQNKNRYKRQLEVKGKIKKHKQTIKQLNCLFIYLFFQIKAIKSKKNLANSNRLLLRGRFKQKNLKKNSQIVY